MRIPAIALLSIPLVALGAGSSSAGQLAYAEFRLQLGDLAEVVFSGTAVTGTSTSNLAFSFDAGTGVTGSFTTPVTAEDAAPIEEIRAVVDENTGGAFTGTTPDNVGGSLAFLGVVEVNGLGVTLVGVPLDIGRGETVQAENFGIAVTGISGTWTTGQVTLTGIPGVADLTVTGDNALTPGGEGTVTLVAPVTILTNVTNQNFASPAQLTLTYVPEPGIVGGLAGSVAALLLIGFLRSR